MVFPSWLTGASFGSSFTVVGPSSFAAATSSAFMDSYPFTCPWVEEEPS
jgi:hypothetical protein